MEGLENNICWVKVVYSDSSSVVFRGTRCLDIINEFTNVSVINPNEIFDVSKREMRFFSPECVISSHSTKPNFERRVDEFANQFI